MGSLEDAWNSGRSAADRRTAESVAADRKQQDWAYNGAQRALSEFVRILHREGVAPSPCWYLEITPKTRFRSFAMTLHPGSIRGWKLRMPCGSDYGVVSTDGRFYPELRTSDYVGRGTGTSRQVLDPSPTTPPLSGRDGDVGSWTFEGLLRSALRSYAEHR